MKAQLVGTGLNLYTRQTGRSHVNLPLGLYARNASFDSEEGLSDGIVSVDSN